MLEVLEERGSAQQHTQPGQGRAWNDTAGYPAISIRCLPPVPTGRGAAGSCGMGAESAPAPAGPDCGVVLTMALCGQRGETSVSRMHAAVHAAVHVRLALGPIYVIFRRWAGLGARVQRAWTI